VRLVPATVIDDVWVPLLKFLKILGWRPGEHLYTIRVHRLATGVPGFSLTVLVADVYLWDFNEIPDLTFGIARCNHKHSPSQTVNPQIAVESQGTVWADR
jgi:hypothetical protein